MSVRYEIIAGDSSPCVLISIRTLANWPDVYRIVCSGTHTYCTRVKLELEDK